MRKLAILAGAALLLATPAFAAETNTTVTPPAAPTAMAPASDTMNATAAAKEEVKKEGDAKKEEIKKEGEAQKEEVKKEGEAKKEEVKKEGDAKKEEMKKEGEAAKPAH